MSKKLITTAALVAAIVLPLSAFAQGGGGGGGGAGGAGGGSAGAAGSASGGTAVMSGSAGTGSTSSGIGSSPGASSINTTGQTNRANTTGQVNEAVSPANPSTTAPGGRTVNLCQTKQSRNRTLNNSIQDFLPAIKSKDEGRNGEPDIHM